MIWEVLVIKDCEWNGIKGRLLIGVSDENRSQILENLQIRLKNIRREIAESYEPDFVEGSEFFNYEIDEETGNKSIKQNKKAVDAYRMVVGYYAVFTSDKTKTAEQMVSDYYELLFLSDYYNNIRSRAWEWVGFDGEFSKVMEGMLLLLMLDDMMGRYWHRRISKVEALSGMHERSIMKSLKDICGEWESGSLTLEQWQIEEKLKILKLLDYGREDLENYSSELCNTKGYFDKYDRWLDGEY